MRKNFFLLYVVLALATFTAISAQAQPGTATPGNSTPGATATSPPTISPAPSPTPARVTDVFLSKHEKADDQERNVAGIGDIIVVKVSNLKTLLDNAKELCKQNGQPISGCKEPAIALFFDDRKIPGLSPHATPLDESKGPDGSVQFKLERFSVNQASVQTWADLLGGPSQSNGFSKRNTKVSIGLENGQPLATSVSDDKSFQLRRLRSGWFWIATVLYLALFFALVVLAKRSDLLRDSGPAPAPTDGNPNPRKAFSLARCQMAFWFLLVIGAFFFIWLITVADDTIPASVLALIGIGAGAALGSALIDAGTNPRQSKGFILDILSDKDGDPNKDGVVFHRFQMAVWTIVLGIIFVYSVWKNLAMRDFDATLLALMGISAGTYLGFKFQSKGSESGGPPPPPPPPDNEPPPLPPGNPPPLPPAG
jgi:hypothetical protein